MLEECGELYQCQAVYHKGLVACFSPLTPSPSSTSPTSAVAETASAVSSVSTGCGTTGVPAHADTSSGGSAALAGRGEEGRAGICSAPAININEPLFIKYLKLLEKLNRLDLARLLLSKLQVCAHIFVSLCVCACACELWYMCRGTT